MRIAILMPVYNGGSLLKRALQSILDQTAAEYMDLHLFLVDNNSTDNSIVDAGVFLFDNRKTNIAFDLFRCEQKGIVPALNTGLFKILGGNKEFDLIARLDADDKWHPTKLEIQARFMTMHKDVHICGTQINRMDQNQIQIPGNFPVYPTVDGDIKMQLSLGNNAIAHPSVVVRPEIFIRTGGYDNTYPIAEDYHLWLKAMKWFNFHNIDQKLVDYTVSHNPQYNPLTPKYAMLAMNQAYFRLHPNLEAEKKGK